MLFVRNPHVILLAAFLAVVSNPPASVQFNDITSSSGITFKHELSPEKKYIAESMSGGVALFDYDNDGYLDIYFVNSLAVELLKANKKTRSVLYHNNHDGTFSDVTDKARVGDVGWGMGARSKKPLCFFGAYLNSAVVQFELVAFELTPKAFANFSPGLGR
jgi:hypothetical protein